MTKRLDGSVVVITGASSGIGRSTAEEFARRGASLVLAARRADALGEVARECESLGGQALVVPTDVAREDDVKALASRALEAFERIDVWVNNAAVTSFGRFEETPSDVYDKVIVTNLFGYIYGARAVLPVFRRQGQGTLINIGSMVSYVGQPYTSGYVATKHAIRGLSECLRMELLDAPDIHVCTVLPATIDTPFFQHAANYTGRTAKAMPPVYPASEVAETVARLTERPRREALVGTAARALVRQHALAPGMTERMMARMVDRNHLADEPAAPTAGNVLQPIPEWISVSGDWRDGDASNRKIGRVVAALALPTAFLLWRRMRNGGKRPRA